MALSIVQITVYILFACTFHAYGSVRDAEHVSDTLIANVERSDVIRIGQDSNIHVSEDRILDDNNGSPTTNECTTNFVSSSMNDTDDIRDDDEHYGATVPTTSQECDVETVNEDELENVMMRTHMNIGFGEIQIIEHDREATQQRLIETLLYMYNNHTINTKTNDSVLPVECKMHHEFCAYWAARGECEARPGMYIM
jgi:hypothetical protein